MGTANNKIEDQWSSFIDSNGGNTNAYTSNDNTNYFFQLGNPTNITLINKSLEMFSGFFKAPLLATNSIQREIHAVSAEHDKNRLNDNWRLMQIIRYFNLILCILLMLYLFLIFYLCYICFNINTI